MSIDGDILQYLVVELTVLYDGDQHNSVRGSVWIDAICRAICRVYDDVIAITRCLSIKIDHDRSNEIA